VVSTGDRIGGTALPTGIYELVVDMAYLDVSARGAKFLGLSLVGANGEKHKEKIYFTTGDAKKNVNFYEKEGKKFQLAGYTLANELCLLTTGKLLEQQEDSMEPKSIKVYDFNAKKEIPVQKQIFMNVLGKPVAVALTNSLENKNKKNAQGNWVATTESRVAVGIRKFLETETLLSVKEKAEDATEAKWSKDWQEKFGDKQVNNFTTITDDSDGISETTNESPVENIFGT